MTAGELLPPDGLTLTAAGEQLADRFTLRDGRVGEADQSFYDTFDGLLHAAGVYLSYRPGELELADRDTGAPRARLATSRPQAPFFARDLPAGPLRDELTALTDPRALLALADVHMRERPVDVLDDEGKIVARLTLSEPAALAPRVRLTGVRGYDDELAEVRQALERDLGFIAAPRPLVDEAVRAAGADPAGTSAKIAVPLTRDERADAAAAAILSRLLAVIEDNLEGTLADLDTEFLHDLRVAVRRSRSVQRELRSVFPPEPLNRYRREFRWLQQATGDARDLDVYVLEFETFRALVPPRMQPDLDPLLDVLRAHRATAHRATNRALRSQRAQNLLAAWSRFLDELPSSDDTTRPGAARPIAELAGRRIAAVYRKMRHMGEAIDEHSPPEAYHELRKKGKELRYLLELFGAPLFPAEVVKPMVRTLKALQDVLGRHQDREIQQATLHALAPEVARREGGDDALLAMGALMARLQDDELAARAAFAERFAAFAAKPQRRLVKATFAAA